MIRTMVRRAAAVGLLPTLLVSLLVSCSREASTPAPQSQPGPAAPVVVSAPPKIPAAPTDEPRPGGTDDVDVVIVGGGLAGLSAAVELRGKRVVVLEKEARLGGRLLTRERDGLRYELGALFAYEPELHPGPTRPSAIEREPARVGYSRRGRVTFGAGIDDVVAQLEQGRSPPRAMRDAFFGVIYPGAIEDYVPERQGDWALTYQVQHHEGGNVELVAALERRAGAEVILEARATSVREVDAGVLVEYVTATGRKTRLAKVAIVAAPAPSALEMLGALAADSPIRDVEHGAGVVVVLVTRSDAFEPFSYVASPDAKLTAVFSATHGARRVLTVYYSGRRAADASSLSDDALVTRALGDVNALGVGVLRVDDVLFSDVQRWPIVGPIISQRSYGAWSADTFRLTPRIFLAGDYTAWDERRMPYGMPAAARSGVRAGRAAREWVEFGAPVVPTEAERRLVHEVIKVPPTTAADLPPLTSCEVSALTDAGPRYLGHFEEGTIAPYGMVLAATREPGLAKKLLSLRSGSYWDYAPGYGTSGADTGLALDGLVAAGVSADELMPSLDAVRGRFYDSETGAFMTITPKSGRAGYWPGPCSDATALLGYAMHRTAPDRFRKEIASAARFVARSQDPNGYWTSKWFPSLGIPTFYAVRLLSVAAGEHRAVIARATDFLASLQRADGSIGDSPLETALAVLTWQTAGRNVDSTVRARRWLRERVARGVAGGAPILHYWFEDPERGRLYAFCVDRGPLARAWVEAALRDARD